MSPSNMKWDDDPFRTKEEGPTDAAGSVLFTSCDTTAKYIRLWHETPLSNVLQLLYDKRMWNLERPKLIISVTGGAKLSVNPKIKETFCKSLAAAAIATGLFDSEFISIYTYEVLVQNESELVFFLF